VQTVITAVLSPFIGVPAAAAIGAAVVTGLSGGNLGQILKAGAIAGATAFAMGGLPAGDILDHALVGCVSSVASGGSCGSGAAAGAVSAGLSAFTQGLFPDAANNLGQRIEGTLVQATAGGLASVAGGGKFANGAATGAFGYLVALGPVSQSSNLMDANDAYDSNIGRTAASLWDRWPDIWDDLKHNFIQNAWATSLSNAGYTVEQEVRLLWPGSGSSYARADIMYQSNDGTSRCNCVDDWGIIDIKTPMHPDLSIQQQNAYKAFNSGTAYSDATRITSFGYSPGQVLPAGSVNIVGPGVNQRTVWPPGSFGP
jgi:hypothetical protein